MATRYQKFIGGLLGEDVEGMSEEERKQLSRQGTTSAVLGLLGGQGLMGGLSAYGEQRAAKRKKKATEEELGRITGRLFGGAPAAPTDMGADESGLGTVAIKSQYRQDPQDALRRMLGTQEGRDIAAASPDLFRLAQEGVTGRTVGGAVYNPLTGQFTRAPVAQVKTLTAQELSTLGLPRGTIAQRKEDGSIDIIREPRATGGAAEKFDVLRGADAEALGFPKGSVLQRNRLTGEIKTLLDVPATERTALAGKERSVERVDAISSRIAKQLDQIDTGGPFGIKGALSRITDSKDAKLFETYRQQLSGAIRSALRIPGEGTLSDYEQRQYGLQLPDLGQSKENNLQIIESLKEQVRIASDLPTGASAAPQGVSPEEWAAMTPAERALFK